MDWCSLIFSPYINVLKRYRVYQVRRIFLQNVFPQAQKLVNLLSLVVPLIFKGECDGGGFIFLSYNLFSKSWVNLGVIPGYTVVWLLTGTPEQIDKIGRPPTIALDSSVGRAMAR